MTEYQQLKAVGLPDATIRTLRNMGATHAAIVLYAKQLQRKKEAL